MRWTVRIVVTEGLAKHTRRAIEMLHKAGFEDIEVITLRGTSLSCEYENVTKIRLPRQAVEGFSPVAVESMLFATALINFGGSFISSTDLILTITPDLVLWKDCRKFLEGTVEPRYASIYFPYTPQRFFQADDRPVPISKYGWYEFNGGQPLAGSRCFVTNTHSSVVLGALIKDDIETSKMEWGYHGWEQQLNMILSKADIRCYAAGKSLAYRFGDEQDKEWSVDTNASIKAGFENQSWYLN